MPARHEGAFYEVPDQDVAPIGAPLPHTCEGKGKRKAQAPRLRQKGPMNHACYLVETFARTRGLFDM